MRGASCSPPLVKRLMLTFEAVFRPCHYPRIETNRTNEKRTVVSGCAQTQAFMALTQSQLVLQKTSFQLTREGSSFNFNAESKILGLTRDFVVAARSVSPPTSCHQFGKSLDAWTHQARVSAGLVCAFKSSRET